MGLVRTLLSTVVGSAVAGAVNRAAHGAAVRRSPVGGALSRVGLGGVARRRTPQTGREQVVTALSGLVATALVNRMLRGKRRRA